MYDYRGLISYKKAFELALLIYHTSKTFPSEERFSLTDQMRRSSRSVCTNIAEAYRKRRYRNHFISKLSDADSENSETGVWMDFCLELKLINNLQYEAMTTLNKEVGRILAFMINHPERFGV